MRFRIDKKYVHIGLTAFAVIAASICFYYLIFHGDRFSSQIGAMARVVSPVIYGIVIAYLLTPLVNGIEAYFLIPVLLRFKQKPNNRNRKYMRFVSIIMTLIIVVILIYGFFSILIPNIITSIQSISNQFPNYINNLSDWAARFLADNPDIEALVLRFLDIYSEEFYDYLNNTIVPKMETIVRQVSLSMISLFKVLWNVIIGFIISIYVMFNKETFAGQAKKITYSFFRTQTANQFIQDVRFASNTFIGFISGKIIDSIIIGCICFVGTSILKTPYALLVSVIVGVTNVIPFFGPYLGAIPSAVLILMVNPLKCFYFILFIMVLQQVDGNVIGPKILGGSTGLSGFWVIFSITVFGGIMGIPGMIIGVPFFAVLYAFIRRHTNKVLERRGLPSDTVKYVNVDYIGEENVFVLKNEHEKPSKFFRLGKKHRSASPNVQTKPAVQTVSATQTKADEVKEAGEQHKL